MTDPSPRRALVLLVLALAATAGWLVLPSAGRPGSLAAYLELGLRGLEDTKLHALALDPAKQSGSALAAYYARTASASGRPDGARLREAVQELEGKELGAAQLYAVYRLSRALDDHWGKSSDEMAKRAMKSPPAHPTARADLFACALDRAGIVDRSDVCREAIEARIAGLFADAPALDALLSEDRWREERFCSRQCSRPFQDRYEPGVTTPRQRFGVRCAASMSVLIVAWLRHVAGEEGGDPTRILRRLATPPGRPVAALIAVVTLLLSATGVLLAALAWTVLVAFARPGLRAHLLGGDTATDRDRRTLVVATTFYLATSVFGVLGGALSWLAVPNGAGQDAAETVDRVMQLWQGTMPAVPVTAGDALFLVASLVFAIAVARALERLAAPCAAAAAGQPPLTPLVVPLAVIGVLATPLASVERESTITGPLFLAAAFALLSRLLPIDADPRARRLLATTYVGCLALAASGAWSAALHAGWAGVRATAWAGAVLVMLVVLPVLAGLLLARLAGVRDPRHHGFAALITIAGPLFLGTQALCAGINEGAWAVPAGGLALLALVPHLALALGLRLAPKPVADDAGRRLCAWLRDLTDRSSPPVVFATVAAAAVVYMGL